MKKLLLIGGGGHCHSVLDTILTSNLYDEIGIIDPKESSYPGISVIGNDEDIPRLKNEGWTEAFITVGSIGNTTIRRRIYKMIKDYALTMPTIIDLTASVARGCIIGEGVFVGKHAIVNTGSIVGTGCIINTGAIIEHDCVLGDFSHISPGATLCGQVKIGNNTHVGAGTVIKQQMVIGDNTLIGAGSVVVKNIPSEVKAYGNPCKVVK